MHVYTAIVCMQVLSQWVQCRHRFHLLPFPAGQAAVDARLSSGVGNQLGLIVRFAGDLSARSQRQPIHQVENSDGTPARVERPGKKICISNFE